MERRTGCLQANIEFLQQALAKLAREAQDKIATAGRDLVAARAEIAELKSAVAKISSELAQMKAKAETTNNKNRARQHQAAAKRRLCSDGCSIFARYARQYQYLRCPSRPVLT